MKRHEMAAHGANIARKAEAAGNHIEVPMTRLGLGECVRQAIVQMNRDHLPAYAGNLAFRAFFAIFPSLFAFLWFISVINVEQLTEGMLDLIRTGLPETASKPVEDVISSLMEQQRGGLFSFGAMFALIGGFLVASSAIRAAMEALNAMYAVEEGRPLWLRYGLSLVLTVAVTVLLFGALFLAVFGADLMGTAASEAGSGTVLRWVWQIVVWPVMAAAVTIAFGLIYYFGPDVEQEFRWLRTGTLVAVVLWVLFTLLFSVYIGRFSSVEELYGALAGIAALMAYTYGVAFVLLLGAELNQVVEMRDPEGKNEGDKEIPAALEDQRRS